VQFKRVLLAVNNMLGARMEVELQLVLNGVPQAGRQAGRQAGNDSW
jgi:hypothetical protein